MQSLEVAGGHPGLIVKAMRDAAARDRRAPEIEPPEAQPRSPSDDRTTRADRAALDAIAARLKNGPAADRRRRLSEIPALAPAAREARPEAALVTIRELCHELRNPLTVILGFAERIRDTAPPGRSQERLRAYAADIMESAHLAMAILGDFSMRILRPEEAPPAPEPVDIKVDRRELSAPYCAARQAGGAEILEKRRPGSAAPAGGRARPEADSA